MTEEEILWELPLCRGLAYMHAAMVMHGNEMTWSGEAAEEDEIMKRARQMMESKPWRR